MRAFRIPISRSRPADSAGRTRGGPGRWDTPRRPTPSRGAPDATRAPAAPPAASVASGKARVAALGRVTANSYRFNPPGARSSTRTRAQIRRRASAARHRRPRTGSSPSLKTVRAILSAPARLRRRRQLRIAREEAQEADGPLAKQQHDRTQPIQRNINRRRTRLFCSTPTRLAREADAPCQAGRTALARSTSSPHLTSIKPSPGADPMATSRSSVDRGRSSRQWSIQRMKSLAATRDAVYLNGFGGTDSTWRDAGR